MLLDDELQQAVGTMLWKVVQKCGQDFNFALAFGKHKMKARCARPCSPVKSMTNLIQMYYSMQMYYYYKYYYYLYFIIIFYKHII